MTGISIPSLQSVTEVLGGGALLIFGLKMMSEGLQRIAGNRFKSLLEKAVSSRISAALLGTSLASILQSSSSASIFVVGFLNAGLISIYQALAIFLGTSLGATIAVQIIAFKASTFALGAIFIGILLKFFFKRRIIANAGELLLGAGILFLGLRIMESGLGSLSVSTLLASLDHYVFSWRISAVLFGSLLTFLVQSPSAATGIVIALCGSGIITFNESIGIVVGSNLGSAFMAFFAATGGTLYARKATLINILINLSSVLIALILFPLLIKAIILISPLNGHYPAKTIISSDFAPDKIYLPRLIANAHSIFSFFMILTFLPLIGFMSRLVKLDKASGDFSSHPSFLDKRVLNTPTIAMMQAGSEINRMSLIVVSIYGQIIQLLYRFDAKSMRKILEMEGAVDSLHKELSNFLVLLLRENIDPENELKVPLMLQLVNQLKHLVDINLKLLSGIQKKKVEKIVFSAQAMTELKRLAAAVSEMVEMTTNNNESELIEIERMDEISSRIRSISETAVTGHIKRMKTAQCTVEAGFLYNEILATLSNIADCSANIIGIRKGINEHT